MLGLRPNRRCRTAPGRRGHSSAPRPDLSHAQRVDLDRYHLQWMVPAFRPHYCACFHRFDVRRQFVRIVVLTPQRAGPGAHRPRGVAVLRSSSLP